MGLKNVQEQFAYSFFEKVFNPVFFLSRSNIHRIISEKLGKNYLHRKETLNLGKLSQIWFVIKLFQLI